MNLPPTSCNQNIAYSFQSFSPMQFPTLPLLLPVPRLNSERFQPSRESPREKANIQYRPRPYSFIITFTTFFSVYMFTVFSSFHELIQSRGVRRLSVRPSVCKLLRKSLLLAGKWPDRHQTCTRWTPGQHASRMCSRSRSKVT